MGRISLLFLKKVSSPWGLLKKKKKAARKKSQENNFMAKKYCFFMNENVLSEEILVSYEFHNNFFLLLYLKVSLSIPIMSKYVVMVLLKSLFWYILLQWFVTMKYI